MDKNLFQECLKLIDKYSHEYLKTIGKSDELILEHGIEDYTSVSRLVTNDIFKQDIKGIKIADFKDTIILFTDLKDSTKILNKCGNNNILIYIAYMHYSTMLLADILSLIDGTLIESTGDGTYSIIRDDSSFMKNGINLFILDHYEKIKNETEYQDYLKYFYINEIKVITNINKKLYTYEDKIRLFFFTIFWFFNIFVNDTPLLKKLDIKFLTRIGCKIGSCKVTRLEIYKHISQDKLVGSIVHEAAHQASGK